MTHLDLLSKLFHWNISLIWPPPCNSDHQDYYMFSRGFLLTFTFRCYREGAIPKAYPTNDVFKHSSCFTTFCPSTGPEHKKHFRGTASPRTYLPTKTQTISNYTPGKLTARTWKSPICKGTSSSKPSWIWIPCWRSEVYAELLQNFDF